MGEPVPQDEVTELVAPAEASAGDEYELTVSGNEVLVAARPGDAPTGASLERNRKHNVGVTRSNGGIYAISPGPNDADVELVKQGGVGLTINHIAPRTLEASAENRPSYVVQEFTTSGTANESPAAQPVPDGFDVLILPLSGNAGDVNLVDPDSGDSRPVSSRGNTLAVTDLSDLTFQTPNAGDGVDLIVEE